MPDSKRGPRTITEAEEARANDMLRGGLNGDKILAELAAERAVSKELLEALQGVLDLIESGQLVRNTSRDANSDWSMRHLSFVLALKRAMEAIAKAEGVHV